MTELQRWADDAMYAAEPMEEGIIVRLLSATPDPLGALAAASMIYEGKVCRNVESFVNDEMRRYYWEQSLQTHLRAPHEFIDFHFLIEGVDRGITHQMVRQRTAVFAQESTRFAVKEGFADAVPLPPSLQTGDPATPIWQAALQNAQEQYEALVNMGVPAEDARGLLPTCLPTRLHYKTNLRFLVEHAGNRLCTQAQFEWRLVWAGIVKAIRERSLCRVVPSGAGSKYEHDGWQWELIANSSLFRPVCYEKGRCPFNADYDRGCTIRPRVEEGKFEEIDPREWLADPAAARRGVG